MRWNRPCPTEGYGLQAGVSSIRFVWISRTRNIKSISQILLRHVEFEFHYIHNEFLKNRQSHWFLIYMSGIITTSNPCRQTSVKTHFVVVDRRMASHVLAQTNIETLQFELPFPSLPRWFRWHRNQTQYVRFLIQLRQVLAYFGRDFVLFLLSSKQHQAWFPAFPLICSCCVQDEVRKPSQGYSCAMV